VRRSQIRAAVGLVIVVALAGVGYRVHSSMRSQKRNQVDASSLQGMLPDAVQWIQNFHRIEIKDGKKSWELEADEAQYLQDQNQVIVRKPRTTFYMKPAQAGNKDGAAKDSEVKSVAAKEAATKESEKVTVTGDSGTIEFQNNKDLQKATLHDNVVIHVRGFVIRSNDAVYDKSTDQIIAKGAVTIDGEQLRVAGNDMVVYVKESRFELDKPVRVTLQPKAFAPARPS
jgi:lipopolysaccharide export system protein LptC